MRDRLLLVDGDPKTLRVLDVKLRSAGFEVETAINGTEAWAKIESVPPDLIIADTELDGIDGFELCRGLRQSSFGATIPFIFLSAAKTVDRKIRSLEVGADDYIVKPAYIQEVIARVRAALHRRDRERLNRSPDPSSGGSVDAKLGPARFAGRLSDISVVDLVQLVEGNGRSGIAYLRGATGAPASIYFRHGKVVDAAVGQLSGIAALSRLFSWGEGHFEVEWKSIRRKDAISQPSDQLVIEGMQRLDAWNGLLAQLSDPNAVFEVDYQLLAERLAEIPDEINGILRLCDGVRTTMQVVEDSSMSDIEALSAVIRLREEGILRDTSSGPSLASAGGLASPQDIWLGQPSGATGRVLSGRTSTSADPVEQSFADRLEEEARGGTPLVRDPSPSDNPQAKQSAAPTRQAVGPTEGRGDQIEAQEQGQDNVIKFPTQVEPRSAPIAAPEFDPKIPAVAQFSEAARPDLAEAHRRTDEVVITSDPASQVELNWAQAAAPRFPASMIETHRGFGPRQGLDVRRDSAVPIEVVDRPSNNAALETQETLTSPTVPEASVPIPASEAVASSTDTGSAPLPQIGDQTVRVSFSDNEISRRDALDELGMAPRWRGFRYLGAALVIVAVAAAGVQLVRARGVPPASAPAENSEVRADAGASTATSPVTKSTDSDAAPPDAAPVAQAPAPADTSAVAPSTAPTTATDSTPVVAPTAEPTEVPAHLAVAVETPELAAPVQPAAAASDFSRQLASCRTAFARSHWRDALAACTGAVKANPGSAEALTLLAHTELNRGRLGRANELAIRATVIDPDLADAYVIIGGVSQDSGKNHEAKAAYRRYLQLAPRGRYADELRSIINSL
jgi:CheY-like chemotaxis protein